MVGIQLSVISPLWVAVVVVHLTHLTQHIGTAEVVVPLEAPVEMVGRHKLSHKIHIPVGPVTEIQAGLDLDLMQIQMAEPQPTVAPLELLQRAVVEVEAVLFHGEELLPQLLAEHLQQLLVVMVVLQDSLLIAV
jgi:hypothetical protein